MSIKKTFFFLFSALFLITPVAFANDISLDDCLARAEKKSLQLSMHLETIEQAEQRIRSTSARRYPSLSLDTALIYQDQPDSKEAKTFFPANQSLSKIQLSVPLFKGFRDIAAIHQKKYEKSAQEHALNNAKRTLFSDVASTFFMILALESDIKNNDKENEATDKRRKELVSLKRLARARDVDVVTVESTLAGLEASKENTVGQLAIYRDMLIFLTDFPSDFQLAQDLSLPQTIPTLDYWISDTETLPSVQESSSRLEASKETLKQAKADYYPVAAFNTSYYLTRPGIFSEINWDIGVSVTIPFLTKETVEPKINDAKSQIRENETAIQQKKENETHAIRTAYLQFQAATRYLTRLERAQTLAQERYRLLLQDNRQGMASNLDVLQALATDYQTQQRKDHARIMVASAYTQLEILAQKRRPQHD